MTAARHIHVYGRVQGVGFRYTCARQARALRLTGWVRNHPDGHVELFAEGGPAALAELEAWCRHGPAGARVDRLHVAEAAPTGTPGPFEIESTYDE